MRRSTADLEVTGAVARIAAIPQKRYPRDAGGNRVQLVDLDPDAGVPGPDLQPPDVDRSRSVAATTSRRGIKSASQPSDSRQGVCRFERQRHALDPAACRAPQLRNQFAPG